MYPSIPTAKTGVHSMIPLYPAGPLDRVPAPRPYPEALAEYAVHMAGQRLATYKAAGGHDIVTSAYQRFSEFQRTAFDEAFRAEFHKRHGRNPEPDEHPAVCIN